MRPHANDSASSRKRKESRRVEKKRRTWKEQDRVAVARLVAQHYLSTYPHPSREEIRKRIEEDRKDLALNYDVEVSRFLRFAWENELVMYSLRTALKDAEDDILPRYPRDESLGRQLQEFFGLQWAVVLDIPLEDDAYGHREDDDLHENLASAAGHDFKMIATQGMQLGLGGGRAPYYFAQWCQKKSGGGWPRQMTITSLTGNMYTRAWDEKARYYVDADVAATSLYSALNDSEVFLLHLPAVLRTPKERAVHLSKKGRAHRISPEAWRVEPVEGEACVVPDVAVVGIGSLGTQSRHRLINRNFELNPIQEPLTILTSVFENPPREVCAAFDICNHLLLAQPMPAEAEKWSVPETQREALQAAIDNINNRMLSVSEDQLRMVKKVIAIAGGPFKIHAIWSALKVSGANGRRRQLLDALYTDARSARELIAMHLGKAPRFMEANN